MRYASVCDGIGAAHVAWQPLGWQCEWTAEIDAFPSAVVEQRWGFPNRGDMTKFTEWNDAPIDLLVGGTPCQSFSVAGLRKGLHDPRGGLMLTFLEIAQRYRPQWVVWENVPGVLSSGQGRDFGAFLGALGELGYGWAYRVLDAQWFGVAQRRRRVFAIGCLGDERRAAQVLFESESVRRDNPPSRAKGQGATYDVAPCIGASGRGFERAGETRGQDPVVAQPYRIANCLTQPMHKGINTTCDEGQTPVLAPIAFGGQMSTPQVDVDLSQTLQRKNPQAVAQPVTFDWQAGGGGNDASFRGKSRSYIVDKPGCSRALTSCKTLAVAVDLQNVAVGGDTAGTLDTTRPSRGGGQAVCTPIDLRQASRGDKDTNNRTTGSGGPPGHGDTSHQGIGVMTPMAVRRLTPMECERLQGFPDHYTAITYRKKPAADGPRYKALGNSMAVPAMAWIGQRIAKCAIH